MSITTVNGNFIIYSYLRKMSKLPVEEPLVATFLVLDTAPKPFRIEDVFPVPVPPITTRVPET